jgi:hypothetical protein
LGAGEAQALVAEVDSNIADENNSEAKNNANDENVHVRSDASTADLLLEEGAAEAVSVEADSNMTDEDSDVTKNDPYDHVRSDASRLLDSRTEEGDFANEPLPQEFVAKKRKLIVVRSVD